jgi:hypothetical protein
MVVLTSVPAPAARHQPFPRAEPAAARAARVIGRCAMVICLLFKADSVAMRLGVQAPNAYVYVIGTPRALPLRTGYSGVGDVWR